MHNNHGRAAAWAIFIIFVVIIAGAGGWLLAPNNWKVAIADALERYGLDIFVERTQPIPAPPPIARLSSTPPSADDKVLKETERDIQDKDYEDSEPDVALRRDRKKISDGDMLSPDAALKACIELLKDDDIIAAEQYVSERGLSLRIGNTVGIHEVLWKGLFKLHTYDEVAYKKIEVSGQTALVPLYTRFGETKRVTYLVMANRGDGWKLDHMSDTGRF